MAHLNCTQIVPIATSAGTIFLLNTLYYLPSILPPTSPYSAILAPWIHPKQSNAAITSFLASDLMPKFLVEKHWNNVSGFFATKFLPSLAASGGLIESFPAFGASKSAGSASSLDGSKTKKQKEDEEDEVSSMEAFGMTRAQKNAVSSLGLKYMFAENTTGANDEALLCLRKGADADVSWGVCQDYGAFVPKLAKEWKRFSSERDRSDTKLRLQVYFASSDVMSREGGQKYFEECWEKERCGDGIEPEGSVVENTTHDSIADPEKGVLEKVLREAKRALETRSISPEWDLDMPEDFIIGLERSLEAVGLEYDSERVVAEDSIDLLQGSLGLELP